MESEDMVLASEFCIHHNVELSLIYSLHKSGLVEIIKIEENTFLPVGELPHLEKLVRLYYEMDINLEGIETITHLLKRINELQQHIILLTNKLNEYD
jgi:chaperone modulatory protein CbpM